MNSPADDGYAASKSTTVDFRLLTYNVHGCRGTDRRVSPVRIAEVIAARLSMDFHFHPAWQLAEEQLGDAVLSRLPMRLIHAGTLPSQSRWKRERRGALWVRVENNGCRVYLVTPCLGLNRRDRLAQTEALFGPD